MNALLDHTEQPHRPTSREIFSWWEQRRKRYNIVVGGTGLLVCLVYLTICPFTSQELPFMLINSIIYGLMANLFYFAGPIGENMLIRIFNNGIAVPNMGRVLYLLGLTGSVFLTVLIGAVVIYLTLYPFAD